MTTGVGESQISFSNSLLLHAAVNDLRELMPVGPAPIAQGIRRGNGAAFFYELRAAHFLPLGPNHPAAVAASLNQDLVESQVFPADLCHRFGGLENWKWSLTTNPNNRGTCAPLRFPFGWDFFDKLGKQENWRMVLDSDLILEISRSDLPPFPSTAHHGWLRVFFTEDVLGAKGRLIETRSWLRTKLSIGHWEGHVYRFTPNQPSSAVVKLLAERGLAVDEDSGEIVMSFPISFLYEDVLAIAALLRPFKS
jgi:hypothetical protein